MERKPRSPVEYVIRTLDIWMPFKNISHQYKCFCKDDCVSDNSIFTTRQPDLLANYLQSDNRVA